MGFLDQYYRAYREFWNKVSPLPEYNRRSKMVRAADKGTDVQNSAAGHRVIDLEWVEAVEKALPSIDKAIRENRRFIATEEEIVPIEKSRRITTESVRHLAQHTSMIASVQDDTVTPESILNIRREESFAIYENRFLYLLLNTAIHFVEQRYAALVGASDDIVAHLTMEREFANERETTHYKIDYFTEKHQREKFDVHENVANLSEFERVIRLRTILSAFAASPLIRSLKGAEPVRPPITRTNLLTKNPYFRDCLELWIFLESYTKDGYTTVASEETGPMSEELKKRLENAMDVVHFIVHTNVNPGLDQQLADNYELENEKLEEDRVKAEERVRQEQEHRIEVAVETACHDMQVKLDGFQAEADARMEALRQESEEKLTSQKTEFDTKLTRQHDAFQAELLKQQNDHQEALMAEKNEHEAALKTKEQQHAEDLRRQQEDFETTRANMAATHQRELQEQRDIAAAKEKEHKEALTRQQEAFETAQADLQADFERSMQAQREAYEYIRHQDHAAMEKANAEHEEECRILMERHSAQLSEAEEKLSAARTEFASEKTFMLRTHLSELTEMEKHHREKMSDMQEHWDEEKEVLEASIHAEHDRLFSLQERIRAKEEETKLLRKQLAMEQSNVRIAQTRQEKSEAAYEKRLQHVTEISKAKLEKQQKRSQHRVDRLERQLKKALKKCPVSEVLDEAEIEAPFEDYLDEPIEQKIGILTDELKEQDVEEITKKVE